MSQRPKKIIILRGPSGSGKSTIAKMISDQVNKIAVIEQDKLTEDMFNHQAGSKEASRDATKSLTVVALEHDFNVVLDGIFNLDYYENFFDQLAQTYPEKILFVYIDISLEVTLRRHAERNKSKLFGEKEMKAWISKSKPSGRENELLVTEDVSVDNTVEMILKAAGW